MKTAERLKREVEQAAALGRRWEDERTAAVSTIGAIVTAYTDMSAVSRKRRTADWRASTIARFIEWAGASTPASELSASLLRAYADHLPTRRSTVSRYVALVEQVWAWARKQPSMSGPACPTSSASPAPISSSHIPRRASRSTPSPGTTSTR